MLFGQPLYDLLTYLYHCLVKNLPLVNAFTPS